MVHLGLTWRRIAAALYAIGALGTFAQAFLGAAGEGLVAFTTGLLVAQIWPLYWASPVWWDNFSFLF